MKKISTVLLIMIVVMAAAFAAEPTSVNVTYTVGDAFVPSYAYKLNSDSEATSFAMGSATGVIAASNASDVFSIIDHSYNTTAAAHSYTITLNDSTSQWKNNTTPAILGPTVSVASLTAGDAANGVTPSASGKVLTVAYGAVASNADIVDRRAANAGVVVGTFKLSWAAQSVVSGSYTATLTIGYATV